MTEMTNDVAVESAKDLAEENPHAETLSALIATTFDEWLESVEEGELTVTDASTETSYSVDDTGLHQLDICINWRESEGTVDEDKDDE